MKPLIIRKAPANLYVLLVLAVLLLLFFCYIFYGFFTPVTISIFTVLSIIPVLMFSYALRELIKKTPQLTFTQQGLMLKDSRFYAWENIATFISSTEETGSDNAGRIYKNFITLSLKDGTAAKIAISHLDRDAAEISYLLEMYMKRIDDAEKNRAV
ncbi:hypothetical protein [Chitinophaga nivalis]|uniref:PH domain-containing protein n=1 Tax=Chitinophaga nivalis TaxID=2991709 RepID=A0ABT3ING7_9BACT|nr:hypothetical protein [Chitinophaga nivalis]MCW3464799.1 hypothetical protein [Chitinophaga nivalis]MCW3485510.1 hypothetical protein [Chitinophaga nivalis]